jgi:hypothetical protein
MFICNWIKKGRPRANSVTLKLREEEKLINLFKRTLALIHNKLNQTVKEPFMCR